LLSLLLLFLCAGQQALTLFTSTQQYLRCDEKNWNEQNKFLQEKAAVATKQNEEKRKKPQPEKIWNEA
jgi:hypothetical protein